MAVIEHEVHESTKRGSDARWGCWNRPEFSDGYWSPDRAYLSDGSYRETHVFTQHVMSLECRNDISLSDPKCAGCKHAGSGEEYSLHVRTVAK